MLSNVLLIIAALSGAPAPEPAGAPPARSPEQQLWQEIHTLQTARPATQPHGGWFATAKRQRERLLEKLHLYLTLYPGGAQRLAAIRLELATLHELGALRGGDFEPLCTRVEEYLREYEDDSPVAWEAAYWQILCRGLEPPPSTQPSQDQVTAAAAARLAAYREYIARYPRSHHVPETAAALFAQALADDNQAEMCGLVTALERDFPKHATTAALRAQWRRVQAIGGLFWLAGDRVDTRKFAGKPVLIVVWSSGEAAALQRVQAVEQYRQAHPDLRVVGVNLDANQERMQTACQELGVGWSQFNDGLGPANRFVREWGVQQVPYVFVISRYGRLLGTSVDETWRQLAAEALAED